MNDIEKSLKRVIDIAQVNGRIWWSILVDDIHVNKKIRYSQRNNKIVGVCYEHAMKDKQLDLSFNDVDLATTINTLLSNGDIHHADQVCTFSVAPHMSSKECKSMTYPILIIPSCHQYTAKTMAYICNLIRRASKSSNFESVLGPIWATSTDGEPARRAIHMDRITFDVTVNSDAPDLPLMYRLWNPDVGIHDPDFRHLIKRIRNHFLKLGFYYLYNSQINREFLDRVIELSGLPVNKDILDPKDKQNVNAARSIFQVLIKVQYVFVFFVFFDCDLFYPLLIM